MTECQCGFSEGTGTAVTDASGTGNHGTTTSTSADMAAPVTG